MYIYYTNKFYSRYASISNNLLLHYNLLIIS